MLWLPDVQAKTVPIATLQAVLAAKWEHQLTLKLSGTFLVALLQPATLLALDVLILTDGGHFDNEHIVR